MGHDEEYIQQRITAMLDWLITRSPNGHEHEWMETTPDDPIRMCRKCGWFALAADLGGECGSTTVDCFSPQKVKDEINERR